MVQAARQPNDKDCGAHLLVNAGYLSLGLVPDFTTEHVPYFRRLIAIACSRVFLDLPPHTTGAGGAAGSTAGSAVGVRWGAGWRVR